MLTARTREGYELPVIDLTEPRFAVPADPAAARALYDAFVADERSRRFIPQFIMRMLLRRAARQSRLVRAVFAPQGGFLDGISTYVMKLGPDNLVPPFDSPMDRRVAGSPHVGLLRLRMQQVARLLAEGLVEHLRADAGAPLDLVNIGGGPALDSLNALILLARDHSELLARRVSVHVLDSDPDGPFFGGNALKTLSAPGQPLHGRDIAWRLAPYDWNATAPLAELVHTLTSAGAIVAASSEGALFEYGDDDAIVANLVALRAGGSGVRLVAGSVTRPDEVRRRMIAQTGFRLVPRGLAGLAPLAARAGFLIERSENAWLSDQVLLRPHAA
ncbi:MAG TPA: hypothetical protein VKX28_19425 [Xanthobacteraceae bacterium]|nr:hypothetical protein [Xanthobacteraceae bacterium]